MSEREPGSQPDETVPMDGDENAKTGEELTQILAKLRELRAEYYKIAGENLVETTGVEDPRLEEISTQIIELKKIFDANEETATRLGLYHDGIIQDLHFDGFF